MFHIELMLLFFYLFIINFFLVEMLKEAREEKEHDKKGNIISSTLIFSHKKVIRACDLEHRRKNRSGHMTS